MAIDGGWSMAGGLETVTRHAVIAIWPGANSVLNAPCALCHFMFASTLCGRSYYPTSQVTEQRLQEVRDLPCLQDRDDTQLIAL